MEERQAAREPDSRKQEIQKLARQVLALARDNILISLRFLDVALLRLTWEDKGAIGCMAADGGTVWYDPALSEGPRPGGPQCAASAAALRFFPQLCL